MAGNEKHLQQARISANAKVFLWPGKALYYGTGISSNLHQHNALQIGVSFGHPFRIRCHSHTPYGDYSSFIVLPNQPHEIDASGIPAAFLWLEGESPLARLLTQKYSRSQPVLVPPDELVRALQSIVLSMYSSPTNCQAGQSVLYQVTEAIGEPDRALLTIDIRVKTVISLIKEHIATNSEQDCLIRHLSENVYLSPSRLRHLFQEHIGLSIQRYILWQRLLNALQSLDSEMSLTHAAHAAGFADSAHLTRTYRMMFGHSPSEIFKNSRFVQVRFCDA